MAREALQAASNVLRRAAEQVGDEELEDRIYSQSNQMAKLAAREQGPDHGRLDRHMHTLHELAGETEGDVREDVEEAREQLRTYRETLEGV
jgi:hypothetical protein